MAERNCAIAPSTSPAPSSLFPEFVENVAACRLLVKAAMFAPAFASSAAPWASPNCRRTAASVVWAPAKSGCNRIASRTGKTPSFVADPSWPEPLPNHWLLGQIAGLFVDQHDHIWVYNRPRSLTNEEAGLEGPLPGAKDENRSEEHTSE